MFNIKNKIYVKHIDKFQPHEGEFILLDGGEFADLYFPEDSNFIFRYNTLAEMMTERFDDDYSKLWEYIDSIDKLRIYISDINDYAALFLYTMKELCETFGYLTDDVMFKILEMYEVSDFIQENRDIKYNTMTDIYSAFQATGKLFNVGSTADIPLEFVLFMYKNGKITKPIANLKIANMVEPMLTGYIESQLVKVVGLITSNYDVIEDYLPISGITDPGKLKTAINNDPFLCKLMCDSIVDVHTDLDNIIELYSLAYAKEIDTMEDDHVTELMVFVELFKNPDIDQFLADFECLSCLSFFSSRYLKFNDLILKTYMV